MIDAGRSCAKNTSTDWTPVKRNNTRSSSSKEQGDVGEQKAEARRGRRRRRVSMR